MSDWAMDIARTLGMERAEVIAHQLRKAKAEGYAMGFNETASIFKDEVEAVSSGKEYKPEQMICKVIARIHEIENGN